MGLGWLGYALREGTNSATLYCDFTNDPESTRPEYTKGLANTVEKVNARWAKQRI